MAIELVEDITADVDARTSAGHVTTDFGVSPPQDPKHKGTLQGKINGGGPLLTLRSSGGSIRVKKQAGAR